MNENWLRLNVVPALALNQLVDRNESPYCELNIHYPLNKIINKYFFNFRSNFLGSLNLPYGMDKVSIATKWNSAPNLLAIMNDCSFCWLLKWARYGEHNSSECTAAAENDCWTCSRSRVANANVSARMQCIVHGRKRIISKLKYGKITRNDFIRLENVREFALNKHLIIVIKLRNGILANKRTK